jgi:hypothetical protein
MGELKRPLTIVVRIPDVLAGSSSGILSGLGDVGWGGLLNNPFVCPKRLGIIMKEAFRVSE